MLRATVGPRTVWFDAPGGVVEPLDGGEQTVWLIMGYRRVGQSALYLSAARGIQP